LQAQLKNELTAINQYFVHYRMFKHWGFERMAKKEYEESIGEMKHADALMERLLMLDALPNLQDLGKLLIGETLIEALGCDLKSERAAQTTLKDGIAQAETARDFVSRTLFEHILDDTEEHIDFLETQLELVGKVGEHFTCGRSSALNRCAGRGLRPGRMGSSGGFANERFALDGAWVAASPGLRPPVACAVREGCASFGRAAGELRVATGCSACHDRRRDRAAPRLSPQGLSSRRARLSWRHSPVSVRLSDDCVGGRRSAASVT
jgi:bacterioferritin